MTKKPHVTVEDVREVAKKVLSSKKNARAFMKAIKCKKLK